MYRHLVAIEICVESLANQWVNQNRVALDEDRFESLDSHPVQGGRAVEQHRMPLCHLLEDVPDLVILTFEHLLGTLDGIGIAEFLESSDNEGLEQFKRDLFWQTALMQLEFRTHCDDGAGRIIDALSEQIFPESTLLTLDHVCQRLEGTIIRTEHRSATTVVIEQGIDGVLEHPLLVSDDHLRCIEVEQLLQPVVPVDQSSIEIIEVTGGKVTTFEQYQWTEIRRNHRNRLENHPLRLVPGAYHGTDDLESTDQARSLLLRPGVVVLFLQLIEQRVQFQTIDHRADRIGSHIRLEFIAISLTGKSVLFLSEKLFLLERRIAGFNHQVILVIDHPLEVSRLHVEQIAQTRWHRLEEPDVHDRSCQVDVPHALTTNARMSHLHPTAITDDPLVLDALVLTTSTLPVPFRTEDTLAEEAILFRTVGPIVDRLGLTNLSL